MKVLVTGATGFLGSHLVSRLVLEGDEIRALARNSSKTDHLLQQGVEIVYGDLKDRQSLQRAVKGIDIVYHAGAATSGTWEEYEESTVKGTERILELSLQAEVKRFIHISSIVVYRVYDLKKNTLIDETCPLESTLYKYGPYKRSKLEADNLASRFCKEGLPAVVIRPGLIYGPRSKVLFPHIGYSLVGRLFIILGKGDNVLPLNYVDNTVDAILRASSSENAVGQAYNIVDDGIITQKQYLKKYMAATNSKFLTLSLPFPLLLFAATLLEKMTVLNMLNKNSSHAKRALISKFKSITFDASKAKKELKWKPAVSLEEGLSRTFAWFNTQRNAT